MSRARSGGKVRKDTKEIEYPDVTFSFLGQKENGIHVESWLPGGKKRERKFVVEMYYLNFR